MSKYYFDVSLKHFKRRKIYWDDIYLNDLTDIMINLSNREKFSKYIDILFNFSDIGDIETQCNILKDNFNNINDLNTFNSIINSFKYWNSLKIGYKSNIKGAYLELLTYNLFKNNFSLKKIERECYVCSNSYKSLHTVDIALSLNNDSFIACECKYSPNQIKEKDISNLINIKDNFKNSDCFIVTTVDRKIALNTIKSNFKKDKNINKKLKKLNILNINKFN